MPEKYKYGLTVDEYVDSLEAQRNALSTENQKLWERIKEMQAKITELEKQLKWYRDINNREWGV